MKTRFERLSACNRPGRKFSSGLSLIELMISIVIGLVIVAGLIAMYSNTIGTTSVAKAQNEMNEDAQYVLRVLSNQIQQAGYNPIQRGRTTLNPLIGGLPIFACTDGFSNPTTAADASALTCNTAVSTAGHGLAIAYEADIRNTKPAGTPAKPTNCLGNALVEQTDAGSGEKYYVAENRFYVKNNALYCAGTEATIQEQPLADNVERIEVTLGTAHPTNGTKFVAGYLTPTELGPASGLVTTGVHANLVALTPEARWAKVVTVRICVVMRSEKEVLEESAAYFGCDPSAASTTTQTDRYLRRAYVRTIALRNRMASPS